MGTSGVCSGSEQNLTACRLMSCSGTNATAAGVQCSKYWMCALSRRNRLYYETVQVAIIMKVIIGGLPSERHAFIYGPIHITRNLSDFLAKFS